jgi:S-adenosylmethionine hydrolase
MKGVILSICRKAILIDITHDVMKFNTAQGAYLLAAAISYFPSDTIHVCVVDPGVGTERKALLVKTKRSYLIGPDNGVLMLAANREGIEKVIEITNPKYMLDDISSTFHGRDIFAAVAAHLANGVSIDEFGPRIVVYRSPRFSKPSISGGRGVGKIIHIDDFGNIITNISSTDVDGLNIKRGSRAKIAVGSITGEMSFCRTYGDVKAGEHLAIIGSSGFLEISINSGHAAKAYKAKEGLEVSISRA